jgi:hypothetical protein
MNLFVNLHDIIGLCVVGVIVLLFGGLCLLIKLDEWWTAIKKKWSGVQ